MLKINCSREKLWDSCFRQELIIFEQKIWVETNPWYVPWWSVPSMPGFAHVRTFHVESSDHASAFRYNDVFLIFGRSYGTYSKFFLSTLSTSFKETFGLHCSRQIGIDQGHSRFWHNLWISRRHSHLIIRIISFIHTLDYSHIIHERFGVLYSAVKIIYIQWLALKYS